MQGLIHIYCGDGKGKTTAALGLSLRAAGSGKRVVLLQFFKDGKSSEFTALAHVPGIEVICQTRTFGFSWTLSEAEKVEAKDYYSGLLEEAFRRAAEWSLYELGLSRLRGKCFHENEASRRMLESCMRPAGEDETFLHFEKVV